MTNNEPHLRKETSTLLTLFAVAIGVLLLASPLLLFNSLLQPAQAQTTTVTFKTPEPAQNYNSSDTTTLTFDAQGTFSTNSTSDAPDYQPANGTFQVTDSSNGQIVYSGDIESVDPPNANNEVLGMTNHANDVIFTTCGTSSLISLNMSARFVGAVECNTVGGGDTTAQPSSPSSSPMTATTTQERGGSSNSTNSNSNTSSNSKDGDSDGVPDSSDKCTHNSNPKCFNEGDTSNTTTAREQEQSSSSSTSSPPSSTTGTTTTTTTTEDKDSSKDSDGDSDGVPDSSDRCTHNSNPRCFKEAGTSSETSHEQQQPSSTSSSSSSSSSGNQTR